jgi:hypothetical protein
MGYWRDILDLHKIKYTNENVYFLENFRFVKIMDMEINLKKKYQTGGAKFKFSNFNVTLIGTEDKDSIIYSFNNEENCLLIDINKKLKDTAVITGISADYGCYDDNKKKMKGSDLLDLAIYFIQSRKKFKTCSNQILEIKKIQLTDNSHITCNGEKVKLSNLYTLLNGTTWYMSRGFVPIDTCHNDSVFLMNLMYKNKNIINNLTIEKSDIYNHLLKIPKTEKNKEPINYLLNYAKNNKNKLLTEIFKEIKKDFNKYCSIMIYLTINFYYDIGLHSFYNHTFIYKI